MWFAGCVPGNWVNSGHWNRLGKEAMRAQFKLFKELSIPFNRVIRASRVTYLEI